MGMYTELVCAFELSEDVPEDVVGILGFMVNGGTEIGFDYPDHPLFETDRWKFMLQSDSYYFSGDTNSTIRWDNIGKCYFVTIRCNLKNYDNEIEKFVDWVTPYINLIDTNFIGYMRYEESVEPTLIYVGRE